MHQQVEPEIWEAGGVASCGRDRLSGNKREEVIVRVWHSDLQRWRRVSAAVLGGDGTQARGDGEVGPRVGQYR